MAPSETMAAQRDEDAKLVALPSDGNRIAFEKLYRRHRDRIYGLVWRLSGGDHALAEDLLQEAFVRAWRKLGSFRGDSRFATWLHRLSVNVALSDRRIRIRRLEHEQPLEGYAERTARGARDVMAGEHRDLERAIGRLPERARTVLSFHPSQDIEEIVRTVFYLSKRRIGALIAQAEELLGLLTTSPAE